jgi:hypothetical protein
MFAIQLKSGVTELANLSGVNAVALVDCSSGMVVTQAGATDNFEQLSESAIEFWRLSLRMRSSFQIIGSLGAAAFSFERGTMLLQPLKRTSTEDALIVVALVTTELIDWKRWNTDVAALGEIAAKY